MVQTQDDQEKPLPLHQPKAFQVYRQAILPIAVGERVMVTQNNARRGLYNGDLVKVQKIEAICSTSITIASWTPPRACTSGKAIRSVPKPARATSAM